MDGDNDKNKYPNNDKNREDGKSFPAQSRPDQLLRRQSSFGFNSAFAEFSENINFQDIDMDQWPSFMDHSEFTDCHASEIASTTNKFSEFEIKDEDHDRSNLNQLYLLGRLRLQEDDIGKADLSFLEHKMSQCNFSKAQCEVMKKIRRKVRNRAAANRCSRRRRTKEAKLKEEVPMLREENDRLQNELDTLKQQHTMALLKIQSLLEQQSRCPHCNYS